MLKINNCVMKRKKFVFMNINYPKWKDEYTFKKINNHMNTALQISRKKFSFEDKFCKISKGN